MFKGGPSFFRSSLALSLAAALGACHDPAPYGGPGAPDLAALPDDATPDLGAGSDLALPPSEGRLQFARAIGSGHITSGNRVAADAAGAIVVGGRYKGRADFDSGTIDPGDDLDHGFVLRLTPDGQTLWGRAYKSAGGDSLVGVAIDPAGGVVVVGVYTGTIDLGTGPLPGSGPGGSDAIYVVRYGTDGQRTWTRTFTSPDGSIRPEAVTTDAGGDVLVVGRLNARADLGGGVLDAQGTRTSLLFKLTAGGAHVFSKLIGTSGAVPFGSAGRIRVAPDGDLIVAMDVNTSQSSVDFGDGPVAVPPRQAQPFVLRYGADGTYKRARRLDRGGAHALGRGLAITRSGEIVLGGTFEKTLDCGSGAPVTTTRTGTYVARFSASGDRVACRTYTSETGPILLDDLAVDSSGSAILWGVFQGTVNLDGTMATPQEGDDVFALKLGPKDQPLWARTYGSVTAYRAGSDYAGEVAVDGQDGIVLTGSFSGQIDLQGTVLTSNEGGLRQAAVVLKLSR